MDLIEQINNLFDGFKDDECRAFNGYNKELYPNWNENIENELALISKNSPIPLPDDYCEIFRAFGGGAIEDERENYVIPTMTFWTWNDINEFIESEAENFFEDCPNALPFGDDGGDIVYFLMKKRGKIGIYMADKGDVIEPESSCKIANSFTELFTNSKLQQKFRDHYEFGYDE